MATGGGLGSVPLQGAYAARSCPVVSQLAVDTSLNVVTVPLSEPQQQRVDAGHAFEQSVFKTIMNCHAKAALVLAERREDAQAETVAYMASDARIVLGGWLPDDSAGRRTAQPDLLLRMNSGWIPVDIKHHGVVTPSSLGTELRSGLESPWPATSTEVPGVEPSDHALGDALQLAHYWRLLEACHLAANSPLGGIIGSDGGIWWFDLAESRWRRRTISVLALYDQEFRLRLDVIARQIQRNSDPSLPAVNTGPIGQRAPVENDSAVAAG